MIDKLIMAMAVVGVICFYIGLSIGYALFRGDR